MKEVLVGKLTM